MNTQIAILKLSYHMGMTTSEEARAFLKRAGYSDALANLKVKEMEMSEKEDLEKQVKALGKLLKPTPPQKKE